MKKIARADAASIAQRAASLARIGGRPYTVVMRTLARFFRPTAANAMVWTGLLLVAALSLHDVHFGHHHPSQAFGDDRIEAALHGEDKKSFVAAVLAPAPSVMHDQTNAVPLFTILLAAACWLPLSRALRRGIMHPKLCG